MDSPIYKAFDKSKLPDNFVNLPIINTYPAIEYKLPEHICDSFIATMESFGAQDKYSVGVNGLSEDYGTGSVRITNYDPEFAKALSEIFLIK